MDTRRAILFAGGGTGGHIYPNVAVAQALQGLGFDGGVHFLVSDREVDRQIMASVGIGYTASPARGWSSGRGCFASLKAVVQARRLVRRMGVGAVVVTGGFVGGSAALGGWLGGARVVMVNVDASAGRGNRWVRRLAAKVFSVPGGIADAQWIGVPLREECVWPGEKGAAREALGLDVDRPVLLVVGGSQGARSLNQTMIEMLSRADVVERLRGWQVFHVVGGGGRQEVVRDAYRDAGIVAVVERYCGRMGCAWGAADLAISRAGALSVAEAQANGVPTIFMPYPHHADGHQGRNAQGAVRCGGAVVVEDASEAGLNAGRVAGVLVGLLGDRFKRDAMGRGMRESYEGGGADQVAGWLMGAVG